MTFTEDPRTESDAPSLINVPSGAQSAQRPDSAERAPYCESFDDGSGFVFDPESPKGVVYLAPHAFSIYRSLVQDAKGRPTVDPLNGPLYRDLVRSGIAVSTSPTALSQRRRVTGRQFSVWLHISNACNLSCRYCYIPKLEKAVDVERMGAQLMSLSTVEQSTRSLMSFCVAEGFKKLNIKFAGGEPTLSVPRLVEACETALRLARESGVDVSFSMLSNGVFVDEAVFDFIKTYGVSLSISIDGNKSAHDRVRFTINRREVASVGERRQRHGTWDVVAANIGRLREAGISPFILCTVTSENYMTLRELVESTINWGVGMRFSLVRDSRSHLMEGLSERVLAELADLYAWIGQHMPTTMPIERFAGFAEWKPSIKKQGVCGACRSSAALDQEGNIASCQMRMDKPWGSVREESFAAVFDKMTRAEDNRYLAMPETRTGGCSVCYWKYTCAGGCPEHSRLAEGSQNVPSPWCGVYRELLPQYLRAIATQMKRRVEEAAPANIHAPRGSETQATLENARHAKPAN